MALSLSPAVEKIMFEMLIPVFYLRHAAPKAKTVDTMYRLKVKLNEILAFYRCMQGTFSEGAQEELTGRKYGKGMCKHVPATQFMRRRSQ
jgi:hypothetical protein